MFYTTDLHWARLVKVLIVEGLLIELEVDQVAVVGPGAELEGAFLHPPKVVEVGLGAHRLEVGVGHNENLAVRVDESVARAATGLVANVAVDRVSSVKVKLLICIHGCAKNCASGEYLRQVEAGEVSKSRK